jgi:FlaA1/EpsC-like NDP-sugar epimerase
VLAERHLKLVRTAGNVILWLAILFPLLELLASLWPTRLDSATWRFGATGLLANYVMGASIEFFLLVLLALFTNQRRMLLVLGTICAILTVLLLGGAVVFVLDAVQTRSKVTPAMLHRFDLAALGALGKMVLFAVANGMLARGALRGAADDRSVRVKGTVSPIVVGQPAERR